MVAISGLSNHNWTAGVLYPEKDACWVGCASCTVQCLATPQKDISVKREIEEFSEEFGAVSDKWRWDGKEQNQNASLLRVSKGSPSFLAILY